MKTLIALLIISFTTSVIIGLLGMSLVILSPTDGYAFMMCVAASISIFWMGEKVWKRIKMEQHGR